MSKLPNESLKNGGIGHGVNRDVHRVGLDHLGSQASHAFGALLYTRVGQKVRGTGCTVGGRVNFFTPTLFATLL